MASDPAVPGTPSGQESSPVKGKTWFVSSHFGLPPEGFSIGREFPAVRQDWVQLALESSDTVLFGADEHKVAVFGVPEKRAASATASEASSQPAAGDPGGLAQQTMLRDIDATLARLESGIAAERNAMQALLDRLIGQAA